MPERPDLRQIAVNIREALADYDREALLDMLTYVFKEYVVEGVPPALLGRADTIEELGALSFADLVSTLQTRLDAPELGLFQVDGQSVSVRVGGVLQALSAGDVPQRRSPAPTSEAPANEPSPPAAPVAAPPLRSGVNVMEGPLPARGGRVADEARARGRGDLLGEARAPVQAPPPRRGLSVSGRPAATASAGEPAPAAVAESPNTPAAAAPAEPATQNAPDSKEPEAGKESDDSSSIRFSLLELD